MRFCRLLLASLPVLVAASPLLAGTAQPALDLSFAGADLSVAQALPFGSPQAAMEVGVATLFQELSTVGGLSVAENVLLGRPTPSRLGVVRWGELNDRARALFEMLGQDIDSEPRIA